MPEARVALVTGCAGGLGQHLVAALLARGWKVFATGRRLEAVRAAVGVHERLAVGQLDVADGEDWRRAWTDAVAAFGQVDVLFNLAGVLVPGFLGEPSDADLARNLNVNALGVMLGLRVAADRMARGGHVVNVLSTGALAPIPGMAAYSASKAAGRFYSLAAAIELQPAGIAVTAVCPDAIQTPMLDLQKGHPAAALTFSGPRILTVEEVNWIILDEVLKKRPLERWIPRSRGWLARLGDLFPGLSGLILPGLRRKGLRAQARLRG